MVSKEDVNLFCCKDMIGHLYVEDQGLILDDGDKEDKVIWYISKYNEYGIPLYDQMSFIEIKCCPWCGRELPNSLRDKWFDEVEKYGDIALLEESYPEKYKTWEWWKNK